MKAAVAVFPGSNCDTDVIRAVKAALDITPEPAWHNDDRLPEGTDLAVLPGGFSYGDYLRCGAIAHTAPIMADIRRHAGRGGLVLGICNGFQILTEAGMLPGVLLVNRDLSFICKSVSVKVERSDTPFTCCYGQGDVITVPIAHNEGRYYLPSQELSLLEERGQVLFRYHGPNPNGAVNGIAGIINREGNVLGMMPHPERCTESILGCDDGAPLWFSVRKWLERNGA